MWITVLACRRLQMSCASRSTLRCWLAVAIDTSVRSASSVVVAPPTAAARMEARVLPISLASARREGGPCLWSSRSPEGRNG